MGTRNRGISGGRGCKVEGGKECEKKRKEDGQGESEGGRERGQEVTHEVISMHAPALAYFPFPRVAQLDAAGSQLLFTPGNE